MVDLQDLARGAAERAVLALNDPNGPPFGQTGGALDTRNLYNGVSSAS